jgi:hypothetical protein
MELLGAGVMYAWWHGQMAAAPAFATRFPTPLQYPFIDAKPCVWGWSRHANLSLFLPSWIFTMVCDQECPFTLSSLLALSWCCSLRCLSSSFFVEKLTLHGRHSCDIAQAHKATSNGDQNILQYRKVICRLHSRSSFASMWPILRLQTPRAPRTSTSADNQQEIPATSRPLPKKHRDYVQIDRLLQWEKVGLTFSDQKHHKPCSSPARKEHLEGTVASEIVIATVLYHHKYTV